MEEILILSAVAVFFAFTVAMPFLDPLFRVLRIRSQKREIEGTLGGGSAQKRMLAFAAVPVFVSVAVVVGVAYWETPKVRYANPPVQVLRHLDSTELARLREIAARIDKLGAQVETTDPSSWATYRALDYPVRAALNEEVVTARRSVQWSLTDLLVKGAIGLLIAAVVFSTIFKPLVESLRRRESELQYEVRSLRKERDRKMRG